MRFFRFIAGLFRLGTLHGELMEEIFSLPPNDPRRIHAVAVLRAFWYGIR